MSAKLYQQNKCRKVISKTREIPSQLEQKVPHALFAQFRIEAEATTRKNSYGFEMLKESGGPPFQGAVNMSKSHVPRTAVRDATGSRVKSSVSYNDLLVNESYDVENMRSRSADKDGMQPILFPLDFKQDVEPGDYATAGAGEHKRNVTWGAATAGFYSFEEFDRGKINMSAGDNISNKDLLSGKNGKIRRISNESSVMQHLPFDMADLDAYSENRTDENSKDLFDDYRIDDFSFHRGIERSSKGSSSTSTQQEEVYEDSKQFKQGSNDLVDGNTDIDPIIKDYRLPKILMRLESCKRNAIMAASRGNVDASQLWDLLAISLGTMSISVPLTNEDLKFINSLSTSSCDLLLTRSLQTSWRDSAIGLLLLRRVLNLCEQTGGVQTLATIICVLGGPSHVAVLLAGDHPYFSSCSPKSMYAPIEVCSKLLKLQVQYNGVLTSYCNALYCWSRFITCTEVRNSLSNPHVLNKY